MTSEFDPSLLFQVHLCSAIGADVLMLAAGVVAFIYIFQDRRLRKKKFFNRIELPSLYSLDDLGIRLLTSAFILMTAGMIAGSLLARQLWGAYWYLDARQIWSVLVWFLFGSVLIARFLAGWRGRRASIISVLGVVFMLFGHLVLSSISNTKHTSTVEESYLDLRESI